MSSAEREHRDAMAGVALMLIFVSFGVGIVGLIAAFAGSFHTNQFLLGTGLATMLMAAVFAFLSAWLFVKSRGGD